MQVTNVCASIIQHCKSTNVCGKVDSPLIKHNIHPFLIIYQKYYKHEVDIYIYYKIVELDCWTRYKNFCKWYMRVYEL